MLAEQMVESIRQVHAGKESIQLEIASCLVEHLTDEPISTVRLKFLRYVAEGIGNRQIAQSSLSPKRQSRSTSNTSWKNSERAIGRRPWRRGFHSSVGTSPLRRPP